MAGIYENFTCFVAVLCYNKRVKSTQRSVHLMEKIVDMFTTWVASLGSFSLHNLLPAVILAVIGLVVILLLDKLVAKLLAKSRLEKAGHSLIRALIKAFLILLFGLIVASKLGIDVTGIVALASVLTLAISLSVQNLLTNVIGGFTLLSTKPFKSGDFVEIAGQQGTVQEISMTYTKLATPDNKIASIPNSAVVAAQIVNFTVSGTRRVDVAVSAAYSEDPEKVIAALVEAGTVKGILTDPAPFAAVTNYGQSAIDYTLRVWCKTDDYWDVFFAVNQNVRAVFKASGVTMTYPHLNVHLDK